MQQLTVAFESVASIIEVQGDEQLQEKNPYITIAQWFNEKFGDMLSEENGQDLETTQALVRNSSGARARRVGADGSETTRRCFPRWQGPHRAEAGLNRRSLVRAEGQVEAAEGETPAS